MSPLYWTLWPLDGTTDTWASIEHYLEVDA